LQTKERPGVASPADANEQETRVQEISGDSWKEWLDAHGGRLLLFARQQGGSGDAEDLLQEAVVECIRRLGGDGLPPLPLVYATIRRRAIDRARSAQRRRAREEAVAQSGDPWFVQTPGGESDAQSVQTALERLPAEQREVLTMKIWSDMTFQEIADVLGVSINTAASRYRYGMEGLRRELRDPS
jgi:RNA polymerase sigma-70 factor (ECF subfamily)